MNIITTMLAERKNFAIMRGNVNLIGTPFLSYKDYVLLTLQKDKKNTEFSKLHKINFLKYSENSRYSFLYYTELTQSEINSFKQNIDLFICVQNSEIGQVYELKGKSFKKDFEKAKKIFMKNNIKK